jgi:NAD(P)-dependent dehydrogenase (short-subunit alcohol dehydrogenase family)
MADIGKSAGVKIEGCTALVTGAAGGIGYALVEALSRRGAGRIYAADLPGPLGDVAAWPAKTEPVALDVTRENDVAAAARRLGDVTLLVNNAAILEFAGLIQAPSLAGARAQFEVNFWGYLFLCRAFAPVLARKGGGAIVNVLSEAARINAPFVGAYSASKAAAWSLTQGVRAELAAQGTHVLAAFPSSTDTPMLAGLNGEKEAPENIAEGIVRALEEGKEDISVGRHAIYFEALCRRDPKAAEHEFAQFLPGAVAIPDQR